MKQTRLGSVSLLSVALLASACATTNNGQPRSEVALRRGSAWVTYTFKGSQIIGPTANLSFKDGALRGAINARPVDITIHADSANGFGPGGAVNLTIVPAGGGLRVDGAWNDDPVHLLFAPTVVKGSVVVRRGGTPQEMSCGYQLDRAGARGALEGSSGCGGMPQETRLEVDPAVRASVSPAQLAVFLVAALGAPPIAPNERF